MQNLLKKAAERTEHKSRILAQNEWSSVQKARLHVQRGSKQLELLFFFSASGDICWHHPLSQKLLVIGQLGELF